MTRRPLPFTLLAGLHLVVVACGAARLLPGMPDVPLAGGAVRYYAAMSGADSSYGFFAPGVAPQMRVVFTMADDQGRQWIDALPEGTTNEARLRLSGIPLMLPALDPPLREAMLRSFAATMFGRHPDARQVTVHLEVYGVRRTDSSIDFPTLRQYRAGQRPQWLMVEQASFVRGSRGSGKGENT